MQNRNKKELKDIICEAKADIYAYIIMTILFFLILLVISFKINWFYLLFLDLFLFFAAITKFMVYKRVLKIENYLIHNKLLDKIGKIDFWDNDHYLLSDHYMIIMIENKVKCFSYNEINKIYKKDKVHIGKNSYYQKYLYLVLGNGEKIEIMIYSTVLVNENYRDITNYLLSKNKNIEVIEKL